MDVKEFLKTSPKINLAGIAAAMWPGNKKGARAYLINKLHGTAGKQWTDNDTILAKKALKELKIEISNLH